MFTQGRIDGVVEKDLKKYADERGWLTELFRRDEIDDEFIPLMGYISMTKSGLTRGPHEHASQADNFCFIGPSNFDVYMWDNRKKSRTFMTSQIISAGDDNPKFITIPPGVVHAYKNVGKVSGLVINCPNQLYAGWGRKQAVDEIRHEDDPNTIFKLG